MISYEKINKVTPILRIICVKMIFYPIISLCLAIYCVQLYTVSSTLLCPIKYCVHTYPKGHCSPFTFQRAAVLSCCACEIPFCVRYLHCCVRNKYLPTCLWELKYRWANKKHIVVSRRASGKNLVNQYCSTWGQVKFLCDKSFFSSPDLKGHVSFCHHLVSVVRPSSIRPQFTF